jgi:hypothetical protein
VPVKLAGDWKVAGGAGWRGRSASTCTVDQLVVDARMRPPDSTVA